MIQFMPANHSNTNCVITILIHSDKTRFQNVFVTLLRRVAKDVTSSLLSWHKFNGLEWCIHLSRSLFLYFINMTSPVVFSSEKHI